MRIRGLFEDRGAVSPVIGVILMVAITVILAAVIGTFVLGIGSDTEARPTATFEFEEIKEGSTGNPDELRITHDGGDAIPNTKLYVTATVQVQEAGGSPGPANRLSWAQLGDGGDSVVTGDSVEIEPPNGDPQLEDDTVYVLWASNGQSSRIGTWTDDGD